MFKVECLSTPTDLLPSPPSDNNSTLPGGATLGQGTSGTWHVLPSISMVDPVTCLRYAKRSRIPLRSLFRVTRCKLLVAHGARSCLSMRTQPPTPTGAPSQTSVMPCHVSEDPTAHSHWCTFADLYGSTMSCHIIL